MQGLQLLDLINCALEVGDSVSQFLVRGLESEDVGSHLRGFGGTSLREGYARRAGVTQFHSIRQGFVTERVHAVARAEVWLSHHSRDACDRPVIGRPRPDFHPPRFVTSA